MKIKIILFTIIILLKCGEASNASNLFEFMKETEFSSSIEARIGYRFKNDENEKKQSLNECRLQCEIFKSLSFGDLKFKGDYTADAVIEKGVYETRELWCSIRPLKFLDLKIGRQTLTWGTGELVFLNDLFPKDWRSFFSGRNSEYLKAPSDALKLGLFSDFVNIDFIYAPKFDPDIFITGERISYWNNDKSKICGRDEIIKYIVPSKKFKDHELAARIYKNINGYEFALYAYNGYWKKPSGSSESGVSVFNDLNVYGFSLRGVFLKGIGNIEYAYYDSNNDRNGNNSNIDNSLEKYLAGYAVDMGNDFNAVIQYYIESILRYSNYKNNYKGNNLKERFRQVITIQLSKLLMNQNLSIELSSIYSPSDKDAYIKPRSIYKYSDNISLETGANIFFGEQNYTFFGQLEKNTNIYAAYKYNF